MLKTAQAQSPYSRLRWPIVGLLFASTVINYIDRQSLAVLAPHLKGLHGWSNAQFAYVVIAFRLAYAVGQPLMGRLLDRVGSVAGLTFSVFWYSAVAVLTPLAQGLWSLCGFRFLLGIGEAGNWPGAAKVVAERFPPRERALGVAIYDSGSAVGAAVAPFIVLGLLQFTGSWRAALAIPGILGFLWILCWRQVAGRAPVPAATEDATAANRPAPLGQLLRRSDTWGIMLGRTLTDPVWFFVTDWFAIYLVSKQIRLEEGVLAFWIPFIAADAGNFLGGGISSLLVGRGWDPVTPRKAIIGVTGLGMTAIGLAIFTSNLLVLAGLFSLATCCYAAWSTMALTLPADIYPGNAVASVSGLGGALSGAGTMLATFLIGRISDRYSFEPVLVAASLIPLVATSVVMLFVRNRKGAVANV